MLRLLSSRPRQNVLEILETHPCERRMSFKNHLHADACINLGHWPEYFKISTTIVIPKPNKQSYDNPKSFRPIVLLNTLGKLIEKVIAERIQFMVAANNFIHPS